MTHRNRRGRGRTAVTTGAIGALCLVASIVLVTMRPMPAAAATDPGTLAGEGGTFFGPVITKLITDAKANFGSVLGGFVASGIDQGISDFVGTGQGSFNADYDISERPLTSAEAGTASTDGRSFAYVPFAATPVAIGTLVTNTSYTGSQVPVPPADFCPHIQLTVPDVGALFGLDTASPIANWADPRFICSNGMPLSGQGVALAANEDPSMANYALMALMDSDPTAQGYYAAGLAAAVANNTGTTTDTTPSEHWPFNNGAYNTAGGDQPFLGRLLNVNATTNVPNILPTLLGNTFPVSSVWTGTPLGAQWNIPTAAVQNAAGKFVAPSTAAAAATEADATLAQTSDPTTNNLVTFKPSTTDDAAYNDSLMEEEYLVVPTNGLSAAKASGLAGFIRFVLGPNGQRDISSFGAAPATAAMVTAGLQVATALDAEAAVVAAQAGASTTTTTAPGSSAAAGGAGAGAGAASGTPAADAAGSGSPAGGSGSGSPALAFTGAPDLSILVGVGALLVAGGALGRRRLRRRGARP